MKTEKTLRDWLKDWNYETVKNGGRAAAIELGFYDWFCSDSSLVNRIAKMVPLLRLVAKSGLVDTEKTYVFFKNNCPVNGTVYDDFRICDIETGDVIYTITPRSGHFSADGQANVWGAANNFAEPLFEGTRDELKAWIKNNGKTPQAKPVLETPVAEPVNIAELTFGPLNATDFVAKFGKPTAKMIGEDGNIFNLIGIACKALKAAGCNDRKTVTDVVTSAKCYDEALSKLMDFVEIV
jgi:hypothetical protein